MQCWFLLCGTTIHFFPHSLFTGGREWRGWPAFSAEEVRPCFYQSFAPDESKQSLTELFQDSLDLQQRTVTIPDRHNYKKNFAPVFSSVSLFKDPCVTEFSNLNIYLCFIQNIFRFFILAIAVLLVTTVRRLLIMNLYKPRLSRIHHGFIYTTTY